MEKSKKIKIFLSKVVDKHKINMYDVYIKHRQVCQSGGIDMGKIIEFRLPDRTSGGYVGYETPVKRKPVPLPPQEPKKEPVIISVMPDEAFPIGYEDFRPLLQRDGLILLGWLRWEDLEGDGPHYVVHWLAVVSGKHYATHFLTKNELKTANPQRQGRFMLEQIKWQGRIDADYICFVAPKRMRRGEVPGFIQELKAAGSTVDFDFYYSIDRIKKIQFAEAYLESLKSIPENRQINSL
jgi:hypothetical protein